MSAKRLYGVVWRWHFFAGLIACPIVFVVALTGALYTFQPELDELLDPARLVVAPASTHAPIDELVATGAKQCEVSGWVLPSGDHQAAIVYCTGDKRREIFVDPYRGTVLGRRDPGAGLFGVVFDLHWELMLGKPGRIAVEWATSWTLLLMLSGAMLWWPRGKRRAGGVWWPRRGVAGRQWLRDLHAVIGAYALPVLFAIAASGLTWTLLAGERRWSKLGDDGVHEAPPVSTVVPGARPIGFDAAIAAAKIDRTREPLAIYGSPPAGTDGTYELFIYDDRHVRPWLAQTIWIDAYSGAELRRRGWDDQSTMRKLDSTMFSIHIGSILGLPGRIAACLASLLLGALCITGPWMWWKRRPAGRLGAPPAASHTPRGLFVALVVLGWLLPTVGLTVLVVLAAEVVSWLWRSRFGRSPFP